MTLPYFVPGVPPGAEARDLALLQSLAADLAAYAKGMMPAADEIGAAPLVSHWRVIPDPSSWRLLGEVTGHPAVGPGPAVTSQIYAVDRSCRWVRTYSRLWRLGPPRDLGTGGSVN